MLVSILSEIVKIVTIVVVLIVKAVVNGVGIILALLMQAKDAAPSTFSTLKEQAGAASVAGSSLADKYLGDVRRVLKVEADKEGKARDLLSDVKERINGSKVSAN